MSRLLDAYATGRFLVLVSPPRNDPALFEAAFAAGVDGAKVHLNVEHRASGNRFGSWAEEAATIRGILASAPGVVGVMPGAEVFPTPAELEEMAAAGLDFFDAYAAGMPPHLWEAPMTRMLALGHGEDPAEAGRLEARGMQVLEASVVDPARYGEPLAPEDLAAYRALRAACAVPVLVPSQKALVPGDLAALREAGAQSVLLGVLSLGSTAAEFAARLPEFVAAAGEL